MTLRAEDRDPLAAAAEYSDHIARLKVEGFTDEELSHVADTMVEFYVASQPAPPPKLPTTIRIGFKTFKISPWPLAEAYSADRLGECDPANSTIRVADGRSTEDTAETLIHEVLHAAWHVAHLEEGDKEERIVASLSSVLAQVLHDNPDFQSYLADVYA